MKKKEQKELEELLNEEKYTLIEQAIVYYSLFINHSLLIIQYDSYFTCYNQI